MRNKEIEENQKKLENSIPEEHDAYKISVIIAYLSAAIVVIIGVVSLLLITRSWIVSVAIIGFIAFGVWKFRKLIK